ncbi:TonB-dependent receptor [Edaphobacter albus]|uniref:TonB-dependent receptor n=1 Tax=Edaphobacter sp. 4G125 TaxID=2763071 RepID=UPI001644C9B3|nr:TonB-dependent receptor [Edaphobacter sp. 4G125]QNI36047.1 TonB-dependent receptor [Edaphobacter sp. 4G125]
MATSTSNGFYGKLLRLSILLFLVVMTFGPSAYSQILYSNIVGNVTDDSKAVIPDAKVQARNVDTGTAIVGTTDGAGRYLLGNVPPGKFEITISKDGFSTYKTQNVVVGSNVAVRVDATLKIGSIADTITVSAGDAQLQTDQADVHTNIDAKQLQDLPQPTRTYQGLVGLATGVAPPSPDFAGGGGTNNPGRSFVIEANGTGDSSTDVRIDGVSAVNPWVQFYSTAVPSTEAIESVNVVTSSPEAEQGLAGGAQINVQLKSGTNKFHGSLYELHQDNALKARPYFQPVGTRLPKLIDNDFGGTIGGPILKDKLFFFGSYEGDFLVQGSSTFTTVPTQAMRTGDFSGVSTAIYDPQTGNQANGAGRTSFVGNRIPTARLSPITQKLIALVPQPNTTQFGPYTNNYFVNTPTTYRLHKIDTKFNWNPSSRLRVIGRYSSYPYNSTQVPVFGEQLGGSNTPSQHGNTYASTVGASYLLSPNLLLDGSWGFTRAHQLLIPIQDNVKAGSDTLGIPGTNLGSLPAAGGLPQFNFNGYSGYGYSYPYLEYNDPVFQYSANLTWTRGSHNLKFGVNISQQHMNHRETTPTQFYFSGGSTSLNGGASTNQFNSYADFLLGLENSRSNSQNPVPLTLRTWEYSFYARDQWRISPKLTITYGTGWEYFPVPTRADRGIERYDFDTNTYLICGKGSTPRDCGINVQKTLFAPRAGIAYRPIENTVVRAGFALTPEQLNMFRDGLYNYPANIGYSDNAINPFIAVAPLSDGIPVVQAPDLSAGSIPLVPGVSIATTPKHFVRGYIESYNLTVEQQFARNWTGQIAYVGTHTVHQHTRYNFNYGQVGGGVASQPFYKLYGITASEVNVLPLESMNYNSMQLNLGHKFTSGFQLNVGYTWSKWIAICCDTRGDSTPAIPIPQYFRLNRVASPKDMRHIFNLSGVAELPFGKNKAMLTHGVAAFLAGGWQLNGILSIHSGTPFSISADGSGLNAPGSQQRADQVKSVRVLGFNRTNPYFDPTAFQPVPSSQARFGTANFNSIYGPGAANLDLSLFRSFQLHDAWTLQLRADALNFTNTPHFSNPNNNNVSSVEYQTDANGNPNYANIVNLNGFGQITSTNPGNRLTDERYLRLGIKLAF